MGGGGANSLDSPKIANNSDFGDTQIDANLSEDDINDCDKEKSTISEPVFKEKTEYFTDFNISKETITDADLIGTGTENDPYIVRSTKGFLYLQDYGTSGINIDNKYIELECDVVLNDESFDENGNPIGGDGVIYKWEPIYYGRNANFDGKSHSIKGLYLNRPENAYQGLFDGRATVKSCKNLTMENFYILGKNLVYSICSSIGKAGNLTTKNGTLRGYQMGGLALSANEAYNCNNYANLYASSYEMGGLFRFATYLENCNNFGTISGKQDVGGIVSSGGTLVNCNNYGEIISTSTSAGGISGYSVSKLIGCNNYGKITHSSSCGGGLVGQQSKDIYIENCANYGEIDFNSTRGSFIGYVSGVCKITIVSSKSVSSCHLIGYLYVEGCTLIIRDLIVEGYGRIVNEYKKNTTIDVKDIYINYTNTTKGKILFSYKKSGCSIKAKNVIVNFYETSLANMNFISTYAEEFDGVVIQNLGRGREKYFYGEDFEDFYFSWKSGKIGLKSFDGNGFYQAIVDKEWLTSRDFEVMKL